MASLNIVKSDATSAGDGREDQRSHDDTRPTAPIDAAGRQPTPISRPNTRRNRPPTTSTPMMTNGLIGLKNGRIRVRPNSAADGRGGGAGSGSPSITPMMRSTPCGNPAGKIAAREFRRDDLVDDAPGGDVGQRAFEAVADLDAQLAVVLGDDEQDRAVVDLLAPDLPGLRDPDRILLDGLRLPWSARSAPRSGCPFALRDL